jgi:hypothetical protein
MKKLQERLKAGIDFNPKKDPCYDSIVEEAETILGHVLDAAEGKEVPYKNFTVGGGYDERKDREIIIVRGDGEDLLVMEVKDESIRVQPHERHAVTLNEDDEASAREIFGILMKMRNQRQGSTFKAEEGKKALFEFLKDVSKTIGADVEGVETPEELLKALKNRRKENEDDIEDFVREQRIHLTMHMLDCSREKAEKIVKNFEETVKR